MSIDYSPRGSTINRDPSTGIRYGIISAHSLPFIWDDAEGVYLMGCPTCGAELRKPEPEPEPDAPPPTIAELEAAAKLRNILTWDEGDPCPACGTDIDDGEQYADEPTHHDIGGEGDDTRGMIDHDGDAWCFISPYFTRAAFCSPCAPGACSLGSPEDDGARAYCFGPDFYDDDNPAPYPIFRVADGALISHPDGIPCVWSHDDGAYCEHYDDRVCEDCESAERYMVGVSVVVAKLTAPHIGAPWDGVWSFEPEPEGVARCHVMRPASEGDIDAQLQAQGFNPTEGA